MAPQEAYPLYVVTQLSLGKFSKKNCFLDLHRYASSLLVFGREEPRGQQGILCGDNMNRQSLISGALYLAASSVAALGQTPEQRANPSTGQIPNPSAQEYYYGQAGSNSQSEGVIVGAISGTLASLSWYKFQSDGVTPISFDFFGSSFGFGGGGTFFGGNDSVFAVYNSAGQFIAGNEGVNTPARGDSNIPLDLVPGSTPPGRQLYRQPENPTLPAATWSTSSNAWLGGNANNLSQLSFVKHPQRNPLWDPAHPQHNPTADWDEYDLLPAGDYFLAATGFSAFFSGNARHTSSIEAYGASWPFASGPVTPTTPFGFVTFHAHAGTYLLHTRVAGDIDRSGTTNYFDRSLLWARVLEFEPTAGIPDAGFSQGNPTLPWVGLPADVNAGNELQTFDLTGNSRIDRFDLLQWGRWNELSPSIEGDVNLDLVVNINDFAILAANFGQTNTDWTLGDFNYDDTTNISDFALLAANFNQILQPTDLPRSVPEPGAFAMLAAAVMIHRYRGAAPKGGGRRA